MKDKATILLRRLTNGEVIGEIVNTEGQVVVFKSFGKMSENEYRKILQLIQVEHPDIASLDVIELTRN